MATKKKLRPMLDIERVMDNTIKEQGIWYCPNESDMMKGMAMIRGPDGTPYEGGLLIFTVKFPTDYPFSPPTVLFQTTDGTTRFHPNLYTDGKVCLSILGTFSGPSWTASQSLSTVLLSILSLLDNNPLSHEPSFETGDMNDIKHKTYAEIVEYKFISLMMNTIKTFDLDSKSHIWYPFNKIIMEGDMILKLKEKIINKINNKKLKPDTEWISVIHQKCSKSDWKQLASNTIR